MHVVHQYEKFVSNQERHFPHDTCTDLNRRHYITDVTSDQDRSFCKDTQSFRLSNITQNAVLSCSIDSFYDVIATRHGLQHSPRRIAFGTRSDADKAEHLCRVFQQLAIVPLNTCTGQTKALLWEINNSASKDRLKAAVELIALG